MPKKPINIQIVDLLSAEILQKHFNQISSMQQDEFGIESWNFNMLERYLKHLQNYPHPKKITPVNSNKLSYKIVICIQQRICGNYYFLQIRRRLCSNA